MVITALYPVERHQFVYLTHDAIWIWQAQAQALIVHRPITRCQVMFQKGSKFIPSQLQIRVYTERDCASHRNFMEQLLHEVKLSQSIPLLMRCLNGEHEIRHVMLGNGRSWRLLILIPLQTSHNKGVVTKIVLLAGASSQFGAHPGEQIGTLDWQTLQTDGYLKNKGYNRESICLQSKYMVTWFYINAPVEPLAGSNPRNSKLSLSVVQHQVNAAGWTAPSLDLSYTDLEILQYTIMWWNVVCNVL